MPRRSASPSKPIPSKSPIRAQRPEPTAGIPPENQNPAPALSEHPPISAARRPWDPAQIRPDVALIASARKSARSILRGFSLSLGYNFLIWLLLLIYMLPVAFMAVTAFKSTDQLSDPNAPWYPARKMTVDYNGKVLPLYHVPIGSGTKELALLSSGQAESTFIDPQDPAAAPVEWQGSWKTLQAYYEPYLAFSNFTNLFNSISFPRMMGDTLILVVLGEIGVLVSSILVAYGFSRFPVPGGDLLFYVLIATILIPDKVTFIPTFFFYVKVVHWDGTILPLVVNLFFGNAVFIFLLRQNFKSLPLGQEESAMLDGASPLRRLWSIVLPQSWPAVVTVGLLQFFYTWNETRLSSLYLGQNSSFMTVSFAVQNFQSFQPIQNQIEAGNLIVMIIPVIVLLIAQPWFMRSMVITGMEKR